MSKKINKILLSIYLISIFNQSLAVSISPQTAYFNSSIPVNINGTGSWCEGTGCSLPSSNTFSGGTSININTSKNIYILGDDGTTATGIYVKDNIDPIVTLSTGTSGEVNYENITTGGTGNTSSLAYTVSETNLLGTNYNFYSSGDTFINSVKSAANTGRMDAIIKSECRNLSNNGTNYNTTNSSTFSQDQLISGDQNILFCAKDKAGNYGYNITPYSLNEIFKITDLIGANQYKNGLYFNINDLETSNYGYYLDYNTGNINYSGSYCDYTDTSFLGLLNHTGSKNFNYYFNPNESYSNISKDINYIICARTSDNHYKKVLYGNFRLDNISPIITTSPSSQTWSDTDWFSSPTDITFGCNDTGGSSLKSCDYTLNGNTVQDTSGIDKTVSLNKIGNNYLTINSYDNAGNVSIKSFSYNYDNSNPTYSIIQTDNYDSAYTSIISKTVTVSCIDNESACNMLAISGWTINGNNYVKTFNSNSVSTETITLKNNANLTTNVDFTVSGIGGNVPSWYGQAGTSSGFYLKTITATGITKCDDDTSSDTNKYLFIIPAKGTLINGYELGIKADTETWRNGYDATLSGSDFAYHAEHRQVGRVDTNGNGKIDTGDQIKCQKRDSTKPTFTTEKRIIKADAYTYYFKDLIDNGGSGNKKLDLTFTEENGSVYSTGIDNSSTSTGVSLGDYLKLIGPGTYDLNNDGVREIKVDMTAEDWAKNTSTGTTTLLVIANDIDYTKSSLSKSTKGDYSSTVAVADGGGDYFKYDSTILDKYGNIVRPVRYSGTDLRKVKINNLSFNNTVNFLSGGTDKPIYYKWPANNSSNMDATYGQTNYNTYSSFYYDYNYRTDGKYDFQVASLVPTKEANYNYNGNNFGIGDINLNNFVFTENFGDLGGTWNKDTNGDTWSDINSSNFANKDNSKLAFWPALEIALNPQVSLFTDNTNYDFELQIKNNSKVSGGSFSNLNMNFIYSNTGGLLKRLTYKTGSTTIDEQYDNDGLISTKLPKTYSITIPANTSKSETFVINGDSNSFGFGNIGFQSYLSYLNTSIGGLKTSYRTGIKGIDGKLADVNLSDDITTSNVYTGSKVDGLARKLDINGIIAGKNSSNGGEDIVTGKKSGSISNKDTNSIDSAGLNKFDFRTDIRKNVELFTNGVIGNTSRSLDLSSPSLTLGNGEKIYYFDYTNTDCSSDTHLNGNNGCLLNINGNENETGISTKKLKISGKNTIIIKGGNINLTSDLYYEDNNSLLGVVILRNNNDKTKGGNIYIYPDVTNTVGSLYAEGSILSANMVSSKLYDNTNTRDNELRKQLLWFGSLYSANTIGGLANYYNYETIQACPYNTDVYMQNGGVNASQCTYAEASKYDLANLRRFTVIPRSYGTYGCDYPMLNNGTSILNYAWAGKRKICKTDSVETGLRGTDKEGSVVVEYNSNIQNIGLSVFSKN